MLDSVQYEGDNLLRLIDEMVDVTKLQDKTIVLNYQYGDLTSFIKGLTDSYMPLAYSRKIKLIFNNQGDNIFMNFDQQRTRYILSNLINNAFQHTPANGQIVVRLEQYSDQAVKIQVEDSGEGIPQQDLPFIFDKYYQSSSSILNS
jgi:signal transduction histidine kinase